MRSIALAAALITAALTVLLMVSVGHTKNGLMKAVAAQQQAPQVQPTPADNVRRITIEELRAALDKGEAVIIDVRSAEAFRMGHIKGALSIPGERIGERAKELPKNKLIVTYCS